MMSNSLKGRIARVRLGLLPALFAGIVMVGATPRPADALTIVPHYEAVAGTPAALSAGDQAVIQNAINFYQATFTDPITVDIEFHFDSNVFGQSFFPVYSTSYQSYRTALIADAKTADDATAIATLPNTVNDPAHGQPNIDIKPANGQAVGLNTPEVNNLCNNQNGVNGGSGGFYSGFVDGCIGVGIHSSNAYMMSVIEHEIDEILGMGSGLQGNGTIFNNEIFPQDLFRYQSAGVRSFGLNPGPNNPCPGGTPRAFFSIDGGVTNLDEFNNCTNGGDYGDWITHNPSQVQDAVTNQIGNPILNANSPESRNLDVIGWDKIQPAAAVPEPASLLLLGTGLISAAAARRRARNSRK
jgi:hypothetical protein